jgi:actin-related protein
LENVVVYGGNTKFAGFKERFERELNSGTDCFVQPHVTYVEDCQAVYDGMDEITVGGNYENMVLTKKLYSELGNYRAACMF